MPLTQAQIDTLKADEAKLAADIAALIPDQLPPPPPPPPPPPVPVPTFSITSKVALRPQAAIMAGQVMDVQGHTLSPGFSDGGRYLRMQYAIEWTGNSNSVVAFNEQVKRADGSIGPYLWGGAYNLTCTLNGNPVASGTTDPLQGAIKFVIDTSKLAEGWYMMAVSGLPAGWSVLEYPVYLRKGAQAITPTTTPVIVGSLAHDKRGDLYHKAIVPAVFQPTEMPLAPRTYTPFTNFDIGKHELICEALAPLRFQDVYRPSYLPSGAVTTANRQNYFYADIGLKYPLWPLLDGPRGRGTITCATSLRESVRADGKGGKTYFTDPWRVGVIDETGLIKTLAGFRHNNVKPPYTNTPMFSQFWPNPVPELVGDWSAIPVARQGFNELWDFVWDPDTLTTSTTAPPINGEQPHVVGPTMFVTDTRSGRVCKIVFSPTDRSAPAKVSEFITGLSAPWGCDIIGNVLYVTEQTGNQIGAYDKTTGAVLWRMPFVRPEGLRAQDGSLYVGSWGLRSVSKMDPTTKLWTKFCDVPVDNNSNYVNLAISDGTFYARGTVFTVTWSNTQWGGPVGFKPDGTKFDWKGLVVAGKPHTVGPPGPGFLWNNSGSSTLSYATAISVGSGRMSFTTVQEGMHRVSKANATDLPLDDTMYITGNQQYLDMGGELLWGDSGFGFFGLPLPWGKTPELDYYLSRHGHIKPG